MKIQKIVAATMRDALARVRTLLGEDAVILSNRQTADGVEILAIDERNLSAVVTPSEADLEAVRPGARPGYLAASERQLMAQAPEPSGLVEQRIARSPSALPPIEVPSVAGSAPAAAASRPTGVSQSSGAIAATGGVRQIGLTQTMGLSQPISVTMHAPSVRGAALPGILSSTVPIAKTSLAPPAHSPSAQEATRPESLADATEDGRHSRAVETGAFAPQPAGAELRAAASTEASTGMSAGGWAGTVHRDVTESSLLDALRSIETDPVLPARSGPSMELELLEEIRSLRGMVEQRFSSLAWQESLKRRPAAVNLMCHLLAAGFSSALARAASNALPDNCVGASARSWARRQLAARLDCLNGEEALIARGGVYAFAGPTGVGKTTTVAKIGARCVVKHGAQSLGLITTDSYRIGAQDQLRVFGRILGVPVHTVHDAAGLAETLHQLSGKRLVLVDTIGMGQRDERVAEQLQMLDGCGVSRVVVLPANAQLETLEDVISIYARRPEGAKVAGAILSKVDEAVKLGAGLDVLLRHRLPLLFCANGQRVPEDLVAPAREALIDAAFAAASRHTERFGTAEATLFAAWAKDEGIAAGVAYA